MSDPHSIGVSRAWSKTVVVSSTEETDWGELDLTAAFADVLGTNIVNGQKYFVEMFWIDAMSGYSGPVLQISGLAGMDPIYGDGSGGGSRAIFRVKDLENSDRCYFKNYEYELSKGSVISTVRGEYGYKGTISKSVFILTEEQYELFSSQDCYVLGRGNYGTEWSIAYLHNVIQNRGKKNIQIRITCSPNTYGAEFFDTGVAVNVFNPY